jgi:uncharacterized protein
LTFVDTGAWVALFVEVDVHYASAQQWLDSNDDRLVTSDYVVDEVLTLINARYRRQTAVQVGQALFDRRLAELIFLKKEDIGRAWAIFRSHGDKRWSFTDCTSYVLMRRMGISSAFAFDRHFSQMRGIRRVPD